MQFNLDMFDVNCKFAVNRSVGYESVIKHNHNFVEMVYIESGNAVQTIAGHEMPIVAGDMFIIANFQEHSISPKCNENDFKLINIIFTREFIDVDYSDFAECEVVHFSEGNPVSSFFKTALSLYTKKTGKYEWKIKGFIYQLLALFVDEKNRDSHEIIKERNKNYVASAVDYIHSHYNDKIRLADIAFYAGITDSYLQKIFKKECNTTVFEYLLRYRIEQACKMLVETNDSVSNISYDVGFSDVKNFYCCFKKLFNMTPVAYRQLHIKNKNL